MTTPTEQTHVTPMIDAYLAGGLDEADRRAVEAHVGACAACAAALAAAREADGRLADLFAAARPGAGYEDAVVAGVWARAGTGAWRWRLVPGLRRGPRGPMAIHPVVGRVATGVAAAVVLAAVGYGVQNGMVERAEQAVALKQESVQSASNATVVKLLDSLDAGAPARPEGSAAAGSGRSGGPASYGFSTLSPATQPGGGGEAAAARKAALSADFDGDGNAYRNLSSTTNGRGEAEAKPKLTQTEDMVRQLIGGAEKAGGKDAVADNELKAQVADAKGKSSAAPLGGTAADQRSNHYFVTPEGNAAGWAEVPKFNDAPDFNLQAGRAAGGSVTWEYRNQLAGGRVGEADRPPAPVAATPAGKPTSSAGGSAGRGGRGFQSDDYVAAQGLGYGEARDKGLKDTVAKESKAGGTELFAKSLPGGVPGGGGDAAGANARFYKGGQAGQGGRFGGGGGGFGGGGGQALGTVAAGVPGGGVPGVAGSGVRPSAGQPVPGGAVDASGVASGPVGGMVVMGAKVEGVKQQVAGGSEAGVTLEYNAPTGVAAVNGTVAGNGAVAGGDLLAAPKVEAGAAFRPAEAFGVVDGRSDVDRKKLPAMEKLAEAEKRVEEAQGRGTKLADDELADNIRPADGPKPAAEPAAAKPADGEVAKQDGTKATDEPARQGQQTPATTTPPATPAPVAPAATPPPATPSAQQQQQQAAAVAAARKVIRNGNVIFEVDSFDSALMQVGKIAAEEGGFLSGTDSEKLPNGRVRGSVTVRCPPDRLDTLVLKLRGLGDLKSQKINAEDVTKRYTDVESQLRAGRAMEERLIAIIKAGGAVKDLLEAERQLGIWREKLELLEGEIRYFNNLISLSTLVVQLQERDARAPTAAAETETVSTAVETEEVESARAAAIEAIEAAKGRVVDSDLKKHEGGQLSATIVADVAPDAAGPVIDRLKQLGKVARLDVSRKTTTQGGTGPIIPGLKVERRETRFQISIYNLANIEPRQVTNLNLAAADVEATYKAIVDQVKAAGGRVVASQLNRPKADQTVGTITFQAPADKADVLLGAVRAGGVEVMRMEVTQNADTQNTTEAKRGFAVQVYSLAHVPAREVTTLQLASPSVSAAFNKLLDAARAAGGRVTTSQLNEQDPANIAGTLEFEVSREKWPAVDAALRENGLIVTRTVARSADAENTVDSKVRLSVSLFDDVRLTPRETVAAGVATATVPETFAALAAAAKDAGARTVGSNLNQGDPTAPTGTLTFAVPREGAGKVEAALRAAGVVVSRTVNRAADGPMTAEGKIGFSLTVFDELQLTPRETVQSVLATRQVQEAFNALAAAAKEAGARVVGSNLDAKDKVRPTGTLSFSVPRENGPKFEQAVRDAGVLVVSRTVNRQPDGPTVTEGKTRFAVTVVDERSLTPRESQTLRVVVPAVTKRYNDLLEVLRVADAQVVQSRVVQESRDATVGVLEFVVRRDQQAGVESAVGQGADVAARTVARSEDAQNTVDHRVLYRIELRDADQQPPRETYALRSEVADVDKAVGDLEALAVQVGGRRVDATTNDGRAGRVVIDVPLGRAGEVMAAVRAASGRVSDTQRVRNDAAADGSLSRARFTIDLATPGSVRTDRGLGDTIREGLSTSLTGLFASLKFIIIGLCLVLPWVLVLWVAVRLVRRSRRREGATAAVATVPPTTPPTPA